MKPARFVACVALLAACSAELPHEAPFDPDAPSEKQARGQIHGQILLENETDHSQVAVQLQNAERTYSVQTDSDGGLMLTGVVPGDYTLKIGTRYFAHVTEQISVNLAETIDLGSRTLPARRTGVFGRAVVEDKNGEQSGGVTVTLLRTGSLRGASAAPGFAPAAVTSNAAITYSAQSDSSGSYQISNVPAGIYTMTASEQGAGATTVAGIAVTGEDGDVEVAEAVILPMFGFLEVLGKSNGAVTSPTVTLKFTATGNPALIEVAFDPGFLTALPQFSYRLTEEIELPAGDGLKTIYVRYFDAHGNVSSTGGDSVLLDTTPPQPVSFSIADANPTRINPITLSYSAPGATELRVTEGATCGGAREPVGAGTRSFTLSATEGLKSVALQFFDASGNPSECVVRTVFYDPNPPVVGTLQINYGQAATNSNVVTLSFPGVSGATKVMVSEDPAYTGADWQTFAPSKTFTLSAGNGVKTVYAKVADDAGNSAGLPQQSITLDTTPPTTPSIFAAVDVTTQTSVLLTLSAGLVTEMWLTQDDPNFTTGGWETYFGSKVFTLSGSDGAKTIYAKFRKSTGLETGVVHDSVILDRAGPTLATVRINGGAEVITSNVVTLNLSAVDAASGLYTYKVNTTNDFSAVSAKPFQPTDVFSFGTGDGLKTVWVTIGDRAGLYAMPVSATAVLDTTPPTVSGGVTVTRVDGTPLSPGDKIAESRVVVQSSVTDLSQLEMQVTTNGTYAGTAWVPYEPSKVVDVTSGAPSISVRVRDRAGLVTEILAAFTLSVDTVPPGLTFSRTTPSPTNSPVVALALSSTEPGEAQLSEDPGFAGAVWFAVGNTTFTLPAGDGQRSIYARVRDTAGNLSVTKQVSVELDTAAPTGASLTVNGGAEYTKTAGVILTIGGLGATEMQVSENAAFTGAAWVPFTATYAHTITGGEGTVHVYLRLRDAAGNTGSAVSDAITFDMQPPTGGSIAIAEQPKTRQAYVALTLGATGAVELILADEPSFAGRSWQPLTATAQWTLPPGDGTKNIYVKYRDAAGNESAAASAAIILDTTPPVAGSLLLNGGAAVTNSTTVTYAIAATDALSEPLEMQVSGEPGFGDAVWSPFVASGTKAIATGDGVRTLYIRFRDAVGNVSLASSGSFLLDQTGPQLASFSVNSGRAFAGADVDVDFQVGGWMAGDKVQIATAADFSGAVEYPSNAGINNVTYPLAGPDGAKTVYARAKDTLGNAGPAWTVELTRDTIPPEVTGPKALVLAGDADFTANRFVSLDFNISGATEMLVWNSGELLYATWEPFQASTIWALPFGDGVHTVQARFRDAAHNVIEGYADVITLDTAVPTSPSITINGGSPYITSASVTLTLSAVGATTMQLSADGVFDTEPTTGYLTTDNWTFASTEGLKTVYARFCDDAGNCSQTVSASATLDQTPPTGSVLINQDAARTASGTVTLNLSALDSGSGLQGIKLANTSAALAATDVVPFEATKIWTLNAPVTPSEVTRRVWLQAVDRAGLTSTPVNDTIIYDSLAPTGGIALAAAVTRDTLIGVDLTYDADVTHYKLSAGNACAGGNWVEASPETVFTLPNLDGTHDVSVRFRDGVLNESTCYSASIVLDRVGPLPSAFTLTGSGTPQTGYSDSANISVGFATAESCVRAEFAEDVGFVSVLQTEAVCSGSVPYTFSNAADGFKSLYLRFVDGLGNLGPVTSQTIVVDSAVPQINVSGGFTIDQGTHTNDPAITLSLDAVGATRVHLGQGINCAVQPIISYATSHNLTLSGADGTKNVSVQYLDDAGNTSACYTQTIQLDRAIAAFTVSLQGHDGRTGTTAVQAVTVTLGSVNLADTVEMRVSNVASFSGAPWEPIDTSFDWYLPSGDGAATVYVAIRDSAGNTETASGSIIVDTTAPDVPNLQVLDNDADGIALSAEHIELAWTAVAPAGGTYEVQSSVGGGAWAPVSLGGALDTSVSYAVDLADLGTGHRFRVRARDAVENWTPWSNLAAATPITGVTAVRTMRVADGIVYGVPTVKGASSVSLQYSYENVDGNTTYENVPDNVLEFHRPIAGWRFNERLQVTVRNQDNSIAYRSRLPLMLGDRQKFDCNSPAAAADGVGALHVVCRTNSGLEYRKRDAKGVWTTELIPGTNTSFWMPAITVSRSGYVHIATFYSIDRYLRYISNKTGAWVIETPNSIHQVEDAPAIAVDYLERPIIAFSSRPSPYAIRVVYYTTAWNLASPDISKGGPLDMVRAADGTYHIVFSSGGLNYVSGSGGSWGAVTSLSADVVRGAPRIVADPLGYLDVAYTTDQYVRVRSDRTGSWTQTVSRYIADYGGPRTLGFANAGDGRLTLAYTRGAYGAPFEIYSRHTGGWQVIQPRILRDGSSWPAQVVLDAQGGINVLALNESDNLTYLWTTPTGTYTERFDYHGTYPNPNSSGLGKIAEGPEGSLYHAYCWDGDLIVRILDGGVWHRRTAYSNATYDCKEVIGVGVQATGRPYVGFIRSDGTTNYMSTVYLSTSWYVGNAYTTTLTYTAQRSYFTVDKFNGRAFVFRLSDGSVVYNRNGASTTVCSGTLDAAYYDREAGVTYVLACGNLYSSLNWASPTAVASTYAGTTLFVRDGEWYTCTGSGRYSHRDAAGVWTQEEFASPTGAKCGLYVDANGTVDLTFEYMFNARDYAGGYIDLHRGGIGNWTTRRLRDIDTGTQAYDPIWGHGLFPNFDGDGWHLSVYHTHQGGEGHDVGARRSWLQDVQELTLLTPQ